MPARVIVIAGPALCGKTARVLARYRQALSARRPGSTLWLAPNRRAAADVRGNLLGGESRLLAGCLTPGVMTFAGFAEAVVQFSPQPVRLIDRSMKRHLIRRLLRAQKAAGRLRHFGPIAETGGLVDLVSEWISELKRLEVWPEHFRRACRARGLTDKDRELVEIYEAYQQGLTQHDLYDAEGRFWSARTLLASQAHGQSAQQGRRPFDGLRLVVADGFTDFTRTQHEILEILAARAEEFLITLPLDAEPGRGDLFAKPAKTLEELKKRHKGLAVEMAPRPDHPAWPTLAHVERGLFSNPRKRRPLDNPAQGVDVLAASRELGEIELVATRIKQLLTQGCPESGGRPVRPGEIAVVFRSPAAADPLVREVFGRLGIPVALESGRALDRSKALVALAALVKLDAQDWPFRGLLAALANSYFQPDWPECRGGLAVAAAGRLVRELQVPHGRDELIDKLRRLADAGPARDDPDEDAPGRVRGRAEEARLALGLIERLRRVFEELPGRATLGQWAEAWRRLAEVTGLVHAMRHPGPLPQAGQGTMSLDLLAWQQLHESLRGADTLSGWLGEPAPELDRDEALAALLDVLSSVQIREPQDDTGRVRVLSARSVRALRVPYVFLAGLSEKAFPPPDREDRLYGEPEAQRLIEAGLPLVARTERNREEMLLFYEAITRASRRLWLSYPALDEAAQPLAPSPYLKEVEAACGPGMTRRTEAVDLSPVPQTDEPLSEADFRVKAVADAMAGNVSLLAGLAHGAGHPPPATRPSSADSLIAALRLIAARSGREGFGPAEGMLAGEAVRAAMHGRYGHDHTFSATELERYASCPFRFFLESVLGLSPLEDLALAVDYLERGRLAHEALAMLHAEVNRAVGRPASPLALDEEHYGRLLRETLQKVLARAPAHPVEAALREVDRRLLSAWLAGYRAQHEKYDQQWSDFDQPPVPAHFEVSFGRSGAPDRGSRIDEPLALSSPHGTVRLSGRIDRVDVGKAAGRVVFNVLDYKTGASTAFSIDALKAGTALQLPVYAIAVEQLLLAGRGALPLRAGYWYLKDAGFKPKQALAMHQLKDDAIVPAEQWKEIRDLTAATVALLAGALRRAAFPVYSPAEDCTRHCPFSTVCRIQHVRWLEKEWWPAE